MAEFNPEPPPLDLPAVPALLSPLVPLNPPMVGTASPFYVVDGENRDLVLDSIRTWIRTVLLAWTKSWEDQLTEWESDVATQLDEWLTEAAAYITDHAVAGLSFRTTATPVAGAGTTNVVLVVDTDLRPITIGDLVLGSDAAGNYGIVTALIDDTHATVTYVGSLRGPQGIPGLSIRNTNTVIAGGGGTTDVVIAVTPNRPPAITDLVVDTTTDSNWGIITAIADATHVTVAQIGSFKGATGADGPPGADGTDGTNGTDGIMSSVVAGANVVVDSTDPANPIVSAVGAWTFTDPDTMNTTYTGDGNPVSPANGDIGVLAEASVANTLFKSATFIMSEVGTWISPVIVLANNNSQPNLGPLGQNWDDVIAYLNPGVRTRLDLTGATFVEPVNNSHPVWNAASSKVRPDKTQLRPGGITLQTPTGSVVANDDCSFTLTACTAVEIDNWLPNLTRDGTDEAVFKISGTAASNAAITVHLSQHNNGPDNSASYGGYGRTLKYTNVPTLGYDTDFASAGPADVGWSIASDTTSEPTMVEATLTLKNIASNVACIGTLHSIYRLPDWSVAYEREWTLYNVLNVGGANPFRLPDGLALTFSEAFTGTVRLVSQF